MRQHLIAIAAWMVCGLALVFGSVIAQAQIAPADVAGAWRIASVMAAPWAKSTRVDRQLIGATISFNTSRMAGPSVFTCANAKYETVASEPGGLFQGNLPEATAARDAATLGIANPATTVSVTCDTGIFDFHKAGDELVIGFDNQILRLKRGEVGVGRGLF